MDITKTLGVTVLGIALSGAAMANTGSNLALSTNTNDTFTKSQTQEVKTIVHDYLVQNPEVLIEASHALQKKQMAAMETRAMKGIMANKQKLFGSAGDPVTGNKNAPTTVVQFFDYQCPHCIEMTPVIDALVKKNANIRIVFKEFPIFGDTSVFASKAALAADKQGKYEPFHTALMHANKRLNQDIVREIAKQTGLDMKQLETDMASPEIAKTLKANRDMAQALQMVGTPAFIVGPTNTDKLNASTASFIPGQTDEQTLQKAIDKA